MAVKTKWAIIGTGYIANQFAFGMRAVEDAILEAVVSRSENSGKKFAQKYGCEKVYTDLKTMLDTEKIDIVYLAIPNSCHFGFLPSTSISVSVILNILWRFWKEESLY